MWGPVGGAWVDRLVAVHGPSAVLRVGSRGAGDGEAGGAEGVGDVGADGVIVLRGEDGGGGAAKAVGSESRGEGGSGVVGWVIGDDEFEFYAEG